MKKKVGDTQASGAIGNLFSCIERPIRFTSMWAYYLGSVFLWIIMFMVTIDVAGRYFFNRPLYGSLEISEFLLAGTVLLGLAYTQFLRGHVSVELFYDRFSERTKNFFRIYQEIVVIGFFSIVVWQSGILAMEAAQNNLTSDILKIPAWPFRFFVPVGSALLALEMLVELIEDIRKLMGKEGREQCR